MIEAELEPDNEQRPLQVSSPGRPPTASSSLHRAFVSLLLLPWTVLRRIVKRIDGLFHSVLLNVAGASPSVPAPPGQGLRSPRTGNTSPPSVWLLWALYAKFAERCLHDASVACKALGQARAALALRPARGPILERAESIISIAWAQLHQRRCVELLGSEAADCVKVERMFVDATERRVER